MNIWEGACANPYVQLKAIAKLNCEGRSSIWSSRRTKEAAQSVLPRLIKGAWQPSYDSCLITEHSYSYPMERLVWGLSHGTHSVNIPCGRKPEYQEKPTTFGRALRIEPTISHVKGACSDDCDTKATIYFPARKQEHCLKVMDFWRFYRYTVDCHFPSRYRLNIVQIPWISFLVSLFLAVIVYLMFSSAFNRCVSLNVRHQKNERQVQYNFRRFLFC
jgi:hypothetical protein